MLHRYSTSPCSATSSRISPGGAGLPLLSCRDPAAATTPGCAAGVGPRVDDLAALLYWVPDIAERDVFVCGPEAWTARVRSTLRAAGLPDERLHLETFSW